MENMIPLNGRIAIVDDKIEQALPLMRVFSKNNIPYTFYKGTDMEFLPPKPENDIRILFLDLNLFEGRDNKPKDIQSSLYSVIKRLISPQNYPYVLIIWSLQEDRFKDLLEELFNDRLKSCAPIAIKKWIKSNFFSIETEEEVNIENEYKIIDELKKLISEMPAYRYLMQWENCVHYSADATLQEVFHDYHFQENWENNANCILDMFAHSYLEQHYYDSEIDDKIKASLLFLNDVYFDTLEASITKTDTEETKELIHNISKEEQKKIASKINKSLLVSNQFDSIRQPGCVICLEPDTDETQHFYELLDNSIKTLSKKITKEDIYKTLIPCKVVVTPACDYAQDKLKYDRLVQGIIIDEEYGNYIDNSEAIYKSPSFEYESKCKILVLNYRYFITEYISKKLQPVFRLRNTILAEIQSKLARHINRQGIRNL